MKPNNKILNGQDEIMGYIGRDARHFNIFRKKGMPLGQINGRWIAYAENLDDFIRDLTRVSWAAVAEEEEESTCGD